MSLDSVTSLEQTLLGHALNRSECFEFLTSGLDWQYFTVPNHRIIAFCLDRMAKHNCSPDEDSFQLFVGLYPSPDKDYGGTAYIRQLKTAFAEPTDNYQHLIQKLKLESVKLKIGGHHLESILKTLNDPSSNVDEIRRVLAKATHELENIDVTDFNFKNTSQLSQSYLDELDKRATRTFRTTGFPQLDEHLTSGFSPGRITTIAGFTGMAKSTMSISMAHRIAAAGHGVAFFALEMSANAVYDKLISCMTNIPSKRLIKDVASLTDEERTRITTSLDDLNALPLIINDLTSISMDSISYQIRRARQRGHKVDVVFIDLFGKVEDVDDGSNLANKIQRECKRMRILSQELEVHFVLVVQIGRQGFGKVKSGVIKKPTLIDIKNSNAYAEESDIVLLLHRDKYYKPALLDDILEANIAKQRDGEANIIVYFEIFVHTSTIMGTAKRPLSNGQAIT